IPWHSLPRTFQDAIGLARKLGILFLWIDSLCIVQDDKRDWEEQSADMANIYQNA
ncbi:heterokaryon incompatibility, partial [Periconia macrospinosa]